MNTNSPFNDCSPRLNPQDLSKGTGQHTNESTGAMDIVKRDRFELLSAYLDGEVTAAESREVEKWLENDASVQRLYSRLINLRRRLQTFPVPVDEQSPEVTAQEVLKLDRHRTLSTWVFRGVAVATCVVGAIFGLLSGNEFKTPQLAQQPVKSTPDTNKSVVSTSPLMVALNNPVIEIPKAAIAHPGDSVHFQQPQPGEIEPNIN
ncbi:anti-sigma factor family protein [Umezakia ovalisporum]|jgi:anti-sigma factor RsiW|uniref:Transcriptional regulator n=1 Tax=Umezakia ovalisporum FSS-62 TaxID=2971776 RepID=A0AA43H042_9CYAN|nr:transcriptional regulator [Umezakia ovalisporum]MBI1242748.1 transcriptional regulator [Nostoc sp. RI_552]MDH6065014.1 transcriptional regulator [Umezakia ovalisporum FSS-62]MDH6067204.1 transcriptional regulator [Umezakia ovalisporum APH033B]MDH6079382.1 transcriptional regulator [Umezakia ovalisporum FSS-45]MDH6084626.1 transcriptional regulator [Umezakia ovalisporum TAC611]